MNRALCVALLPATLLGGCMVGPDFERPVVEAPAVFKQKPLPETASITTADDIDPEWWKLLGDPVLDELVEKLEEQNFDVQIASARMQQSRAIRRVAGAAQNPSIGAAGSFYEERASPNGILSLLGTEPASAPPPSAGGDSGLGVVGMPGEKGSPPFGLWQFGFDALWELDIWGKARRAAEAADAGMEAAAEERRGILLSVEAELARNYVELRATQKLLHIVENNLDIAKDSLKLTEVRYSEGVITQLDVADAAAQVAGIEARVPKLEAREEALMNAISLLLGQMPGALEEELEDAVAIPGVPAKVPVGLPSDLARRRPDIRAAEARLHQATAAIGVAKADFYPSISLTGSLGAQALQLSGLGNWNSHQFVIGPSISLPFFQGGKLKGQLDLRKAEQKEAAIVFRQTVMRAWHEVDDALTEYNAEQRRQARLAEAVRHHKKALEVAQLRYREGAIDFLNVLTVQAALLDAESALAESDAGVSLHLVALCKALGGGWARG